MKLLLLNILFFFFQIVLEHIYNLYINLNSQNEFQATIKDPKDFSNVIKVDTHIHLAAAMTPKKLLNFIVDKATNCPNVISNTNSKSNHFIEKKKGYCKIRRRKANDIRSFF